VTRLGSADAPQGVLTLPEIVGKLTMLASPAANVADMAPAPVLQRFSTGGWFGSVLVFLAEHGAGASARAGNGPA
jgi:hypothetical protein